jgi:hypothetical protein
MDNSIGLATTAMSGIASQASNIHMGERNTEEVNNNLDTSID